MEFGKKLEEGRPFGKTGKEIENILLEFFVNKSTAASAAGTTKISRNTINRYFNEFRYLIFRSLRKAPRFSGVIEIDEKQYGRRRRPREKRIAKKGEYLPRYKYGRENTVLVFAILQRDRKGSRVYTHIIKDTKRRTLSPIIHMIVEGGSKIYSDGHRSYSRLRFNGYKHKAVIHKRSWTNGPGIHINGVESFFGFSKGLMKRFCGVPKRTFPLHIKECEFRHNNRGKVLEAMKRLLAERT